MGADATLDHAETLAMAFAELGRFDEARSWQEQVVQEATRRSDPHLELRRSRLETYRRNEPVRSPWVAEGPS